MGIKLVVDSNSIRDFLKYYYFDREYTKTNYNKLKKFLLEKIESREIIILDKAYRELEDLKDSQLDKVRQKISYRVEETLGLNTEVQRLINAYQKRDNIFNLNSSMIDAELDKYEQKYADLYLIAYCLQLKSTTRDEVFLITEETRRNDSKIIEKIPTICGKEKINCRNIAYVLFEIYRDKLKFSLDIPN